MVGMVSRILLAVTGVAASGSADHYGHALLQTYDAVLEHGTGGSHDTPVTKVVSLLQEMSKTLSKEQDEDEALYKKLACWCSNNKWEKGNAVEASEAKIAELQSTIESTTAQKAELTQSLSDLEASIAADKKSLAEVTAIREKQLSESHGEEMDSVQNIEALKAAIEVLSKHHSAPPKSTVAGGAIFKSERDQWSTFLQVKSHGFPWSESSSARELDDFMRHSGYDANPSDDALNAHSSIPRQKFLQQESGAVATESDSSQEWSSADMAIVQRAMKSASAFVQAHHGAGYYPAYTAQSGEIMGVLQQLKEEMEANLSESQKQEADRAAAFAELRSAKSTQIESEAALSEQKEDELATASNTLANAKEDLAREEATLSEDQLFLRNLGTTCATAETDFAARKKARMAEITAVSQTIEILMADKARDAMSGTFSFVQLKSSRSHREEQHRRDAAAALRKVAQRVHAPELSILATQVELDAFTKVKKAIDDMIAMLKTQQADEVKKNDWCKAEIHENEMTTAKGMTEKSAFEAKVADLDSSIKSLQDGIADGKARIAELQLELQRASEGRKTENQEFQNTIADQTATIDVLHKALDRLAKYYELVQVQQGSHVGQTPPMPQKMYAPSQGAPSVMEMIEKLIYDAQELMTESKKSENTAQAAYEQNIADTNSGVAALQKEVLSKTQEKAGARKDKAATESDLSDTITELDGLAKFNLKLHTECDYLLNNFDLRQNSRAQEVEALQQAKQILNGASLS